MKRHRRATGEYIKELHDVILRLHGAEATYLRSVPVTEKFQGKVVWDGTVEVFKLAGHSTASMAYAWAFDSPNRHYVAVLRVAPVTSPKLAVRAAIIQEHRSAKKN
jgi:class 3 adenylate cyclase